MKNSVRELAPTSLWNHFADLNAVPRPSKKEQKVTTNHEARVVDTPADPPATVVNSPGNVGLTVRIEINLPANGSQATYDNIFKSIRENLLKQNA